MENRIKQNKYVNKLKLLLVLGTLAFCLAACGEESIKWQNVAGESLTLNMTEEELVEVANTLDMDLLLEQKEKEELEEVEVIEARQEAEAVATETENVETVELAENAEDEEGVEEEVIPFLLENLSFEASVTENSDGYVHATYRIIDGNGATIQTIENEPFFTKDWFYAFEENSCFFMDYNFDGFLDVITIGSSGYVNSYNFAYLWNEEAQQFLFSSEASDIANAVVYAENEQIISVSRDAGLPIYRLYELRENLLTLVAEVTEVYDGDGNIICTESILGNEGTTIVTKREDLDAIWDGYNIELYK